MKTTIGAAMYDQFRLSPTFFVGVDARKHIKRFKKEMSALAKLIKKLQDADQSLNINAVRKYLREYFSTLKSMEDDVGTASRDVYVMEYRGLQTFKKFHDEFVNAIKNPKLTPDLRQRLEALFGRYKALVSELEQKLYNVDQEVRRNKVGRHMLKDFQINELFAMYFQMRTTVSDLRRKDSRAKSEEHRLASELSSLLSLSSNPKQQQSVVKRLESDFEDFLKAIGTVVMDSVFLERMLLELRHRIENMTDDEVEMLVKLSHEGFPEKELQDINDNYVKKLKDLIAKDFDFEYAQSREMGNIIRQTA
jgi:DNA repair exonuclease SbcCD ATPase subunit